MTGTHHWTAASTEDFVFSISSGFTSQIETKMQEEELSRSELAKRLGKTTGRVSQVLNDPGNLGLKLMVEYARALGMKISIVAYDDHDPNNIKGPIRPDVFVKCWELANCPPTLIKANRNGEHLSGGEIAPTATWGATSPKFVAFGRNYQAPYTKQNFGQIVTIQPRVPDMPTPATQHLQEKRA